MRRLLAPAFPLALLALASCGSEPQPEPTPTPTQTPVGPRKLVAAGFDDQNLGPRIVGPQGPEVTAALTIDGREVGEIVSYVACPAPPTQGDEAELVPVQEGDECDPTAQEEGAVFTYVHRITPAEGMEGQLLSFRTSRPATGFANTIGFDREEAAAALGEDYGIGVSLDNGALIWRVEAGDGWDAGETITLFWQSTLPPEGPADAYEVETADGRGTASGPFPPKEEAAEETAPPS